MHLRLNPSQIVSVNTGIVRKGKPPGRVYVTPPILKSNLHRIVTERRSARPTIHERFSAPLPSFHPGSFRSLAQALAPRYSQGRRGTICHGHRESRSDDRA